MTKDEVKEVKADLDQLIKEFGSNLNLYHHNIPSVDARNVVHMGKEEISTFSMLQFFHSRIQDIHTTYQSMFDFRQRLGKILDNAWVDDADE